MKIIEEICLFLLAALNVCETQTLVSVKITASFLPLFKSHESIERKNKQTLIILIICTYTKRVKKNSMLNKWVIQIKKVFLFCSRLIYDT